MPQGANILDRFSYLCIFWWKRKNIAEVWKDSNRADYWKKFPSVFFYWFFWSLYLNGALNVVESLKFMYTWRKAFSSIQFFDFFS